MDEGFEGSLESLGSFSLKALLVAVVVALVIGLSYIETNAVMQRQVQAMVDDFAASTPNAESFMGAYSLCRRGADESNDCALEAAYLVEPLIGKREAGITLSLFRLVRAEMKRLVENYDIWRKTLTFKVWREEAVKVWREEAVADKSGEVDAETRMKGLGRY